MIEMADEPVERMIRFRVEREATENIHNDLANASHYFKKRIAEREAKGDRQGIALEMMAGLTMTAFWIEAGINYLGFTLPVTGWEERESGAKKIAKVVKHLGLKPDFTRRPWSVIATLKEFRDTLAHGKPETLKDEKIIVRKFGFADRPEPLESDWVKALTTGKVVECYDDANAIWLDMLGAAGISEISTGSSASSGMVYLGEADA